MRFKVTYSSGTSHEVDLPASVVVIGRDPGCDIVLNDTKCSRRHAVVEQGADGLSVRDSGSANGVYLNGRRVETAALEPGDTIRLGDVQLGVLAEIGETVVVALEDVELRQDAPKAPVPSPASFGPTREPLGFERRTPAPRPRAVAAGTAPSEYAPAARRPLTVSVLSLLWALFAPGSAAAVILTTARLGAGTVAWLAAALVCLGLGATAVTMALGLWRLAPWARHLQVGVAYLGLVACPFTLVSATVLLYMGRPDVRLAFEPRVQGRPRPGAGEAEPTFAMSIIAMLVVGFVATGGALLLLRRP